MKWVFKSQQVIESFQELQNIFSKNRNITDSVSFFHPSHPYDISFESLGFDSEAIKKILARLRIAYKNQEKILIFGDYDADGVCAVAILYQTFHDLGFQVDYFFPDRFKHGYGLTVQALTEIYKHNFYPVVITVDNGIVAHESADYLFKKKVDLIITDHHLPREDLPHCYAIFHSLELCGASVAWYLAKLLIKKQVEQFLDLAGIATIADLVPLQKYNRSFAYYGLDALRKTTHPGILALFEAAKINQKSLDEVTVAYLIAPRINASGRLAQANLALDLLITQEKTQAIVIAHQLNNLNQQRQDLTKNAYQDLLHKESFKNKLIFTVGDYHEGVIGLIAGKICETFYKPSIVATKHQHIYKASARSIPGINITDFLNQFKNQLISIGGHPMAAGFSFEEQEYQSLLSNIENASQHFENHLFDQHLAIDAILDHSLLSLSLLDILESYRPFGSHNELPIFVANNLQIVDMRGLAGDKHLKIALKDQKTSKKVVALAWNASQNLKKLKLGEVINLAFTAQKNIYKNQVYLQLIIKDINYC